MEYRWIILNSYRIDAVDFHAAVFFQGTESHQGIGIPEILFYDRMDHYIRDKEADMDSAIRIVAISNSVPLYQEGILEQLPDERWDWILPKAVHDSHTEQIPKLQAAIQVMVPPEHQGKGKCALAIECMKQIGLNLGDKDLIIPARPSLKYQHPVF